MVKSAPLNSSKNKYTNSDVEFSSTILGDDEAHNVEEVPQDNVVVFDWLSIVPDLFEISMHYSDTAELNQGMLLNQNSLSIHQGKELPFLLSMTQTCQSDQSKPSVPVQL